MYASGVTALIVQIRVNGRFRTFTIRRYRATGVTEAHRRGAELPACIWADDPRTPVRKRGLPPVSSRCGRYLRQRKGRWKPSSLETYDIYMRFRRKRHFGRLWLDSIDHARVSAWVDAASAEKSGVANRASAIVRAMLNAPPQ